MVRYKLPVDYTKLHYSEKRLVREQYEREQKNLCYYCGESLDEPAPDEIKEKEIVWDMFPKNFLDSPIHLQHNHNTGMTEGAVHNYCNAVLWVYHNR